MTEPLQKSDEYKAELLVVEGSQLPDRPGAGINRNALDQKRAWFKKGAFTETSYSEPRSSVVCGTTVVSTRSASPKGALTTSTGRTLAAIPRSKSHTSPRRGAIFILVQKGKQASASLPNFVVFYWSRVVGQGQAEEFRREYPLLAFWQLIEFLKELACFLDHIQNLAQRCVVRNLDQVGGCNLLQTDELLMGPLKSEWA